MQCELELAWLAAPDLGHGARPEHLAEYRRVLEQALALGRKGVKAGGDQRLQTLGQCRLRKAVSPRLEAAVYEQAHELLRIERVAARPLEDRLLEIAAEDGRGDELRDELGRLLIGQRREVDRVGVALPGAPARPALADFPASGDHSFGRGDSAATRPSTSSFGGAMRAEPLIARGIGPRNPRSLRLVSPTPRQSMARAWPRTVTRSKVAHRSRAHALRPAAKEWTPDVDVRPRPPGPLQAEAAPARTTWRGRSRSSRRP